MAEIPAGAAVVTPDQMLQTLQQVRDVVLDLQSTMKPSLDRLQNGLEHETTEREKLDARVEDHFTVHEAAIRKLREENARTSWLPRAAWGIGSGTVGIIGTILVTLIIDHM